MHDEFSSLPANTLKMSVREWWRGFLCFQVVWVFFPICLFVLSQIFGFFFYFMLITVKWQNMCIFAITSFQRISSCHITCTSLVRGKNWWHLHRTKMKKPIWLVLKKILLCISNWERKPDTKISFKEQGKKNLSWDIKTFTILLGWDKDDPEYYWMLF